MKVSRARGAGPAASLFFTALATAWTLRLWDWRPGTPFGMRGDEVFIHAQIKTTLETGWFWSNPRLGAPFEMAGYLFPETSVLQLAAIRMIGPITDDPFTVGFVYFVASTLLSALAFHMLARSEGLSRMPSVATSVLFAMAPGHQLKYGHLWLASLWVVPLVIWLSLRVLRGRLWCDHRWLTVVALVAVGLSNIYYAAFAIILVMLLGLVRRIAVKDPQGTYQGLTAAVLVGLPVLIYLTIARLASRAQVVTGQPPAKRIPSESETYAGKLMDLLLPWVEHRWELPRRISELYNAMPNATVERPALGLVGLVGLMALGAVVAKQLAPHQSSAPLQSAERQRAWALVAAIAFLFYTVGGLGSFVGFFVTPQLRTWSRWYIVILAVALLCVGALLHRVRVRHPLAGIVTIVLVGILGVLDQTNPAMAPDYAAERLNTEDVRRYTALSFLVESVGTESRRLGVCHSALGPWSIGSVPARAHE